MKGPLRAAAALIASTLVSWGAAVGGCGAEPSGSGGAVGGATTTTSASTTEDSGADTGCTACFGTPDCPTPPSDCIHATCGPDQCCGTTNLPAGRGCNSNGGYLCDGKGHCVQCNVPGDCPPTGTVCAAKVCQDHACVVLSVLAGAPCWENGGHVCDGKNHCADCSAAADCPATGTACAQPTCGAGNVCGTTSAAKGSACDDHGGANCDGKGRCTLTTCLDGKRNGDETDVDCGGSCPPCATGKACATGADCIDTLCGTGSPSVCLAPTCSDGARNGNETDVDCGGACPPCADTLHCTVGADCAHGRCFGYHPGTCVSCDDGVRDGSETDVDCGGGPCSLMGKRCQLGQGCILGSDCVSTFCTSGTCTLVPDGQACGNNDQCQSGHCQLETCCHVACPASPPSSCGNNLLCTPDGLSCQKYAVGTVCGSPSCSGGMLTRGGCDGAGSCLPGTPAPCPGHFACQSDTACRTTCTSDGECAAGYHCQKPGLCLAGT